MADPTLQDLFPGATQTADAITIPKAAFSRLTPRADNSAQELFVALTLRASEFFTPAARDADPDRKIEVTYDGQSIFTVAGSTELDRQDTYTTILHKAVARADVDPDDY